MEPPDAVGEISSQLTQQCDFGSIESARLCGIDRKRPNCPVVQQDGQGADRPQAEFGNLFSPRGSSWHVCELVHDLDCVVPKGRAGNPLAEFVVAPADMKPG